jgi:hypothetical protein
MTDQEREEFEDLELAADDAEDVKGGADIAGAGAAGLQAAMQSLGRSTAAGQGAPQAPPQTGPTVMGPGSRPMPGRLPPKPGIKGTP